ncbi:signal peptide protein [Rhodopirellula maiorica SM1]|uniref:Signal peptide protein n=2 Tax=Novipirellula TaxID=2795426 RepID=M5RFZ5_9BACT|nr:signal peptide protein [Rhodopirellula maiorica SM1]
MVLSAIVFVQSAGPSKTLQANGPEITFDLPLVVAAVSNSCDSNGARLVDVELKLSSMIVAPEPKRIDQWIVRCQPRDRAMQISDYAPQTEVASPVQGPIQIKTTDENANTAGLSVNGAFSHFASGSLGVDQSNKVTESLQYDRVSAVQTVTAAGTINRGRGVYFKLKWTEQQVLEGEKTFRLTFRVPDQWRGGLIDVSVIAQSEKKSFGGWDKEVVTLGNAHFVVAAYNDGDQTAFEVAKSLSNAEDALRRAAIQHLKKRNDSLPSLVRSVTQIFDTKDRNRSIRWVERLLLDNTNPYSDKEILELPVQTRVIAIDYCEAREKFARLNEPSPIETTMSDVADAGEPTKRYSAAKPVVE